MINLIQERQGGWDENFKEETKSKSLTESDVRQ